MVLRVELFFQKKSRPANLHNADSTVAVLNIRTAQARRPEIRAES